MKRWYVVQTNPREEERALHYLNEKGVETFFPKIQMVRYRSTRAGMVIRVAMSNAFSSPCSRGPNPEG